MVTRGKRVLSILMGFFIGSVVTAAAFLALGKTGIPPVPDMTDNLQAAPPAASYPSEITAAYSVAAAIADEDYAALAAWVHPQEGVLFAPYSTVDKTHDVILTAEQIKKIPEDKTELVWGAYDGSGEPIMKTPSEFFGEFLRDHDYTVAPVVSINTIAKSGNSLENVAEEFPDAAFVDLHYPGFDQSYQGIDWKTLRLVFENTGDETGSELKLVAIIHCMWTI